MGIEPTQPAWTAGALPLSYTRANSRIPTLAGPTEQRRREARQAARRNPYRPSPRFRSPLNDPFEVFEPFRLDLPSMLGDSTWVEQDSNLRRQCHQIYSLAPLAAWVSTRLGSHHPAARRPDGRCSGDSAIDASLRATELAVRVELTTYGLQNRCSAS